MILKMRMIYINTRHKYQWVCERVPCICFAETSSNIKVELDMNFSCRYSKSSLDGGIVGVYLCL